jgi:very-short-patch-repair endonuclease
MKNGIRTYICVGCGKSVTKSCTKNVKFCNAVCYHAHGKTGRNKTGENKTCVKCGKSFYVPKSRIEKAIACSPKCHNLFQGRNKIELICKTCGIAFKVSPARIKFDNRTYCSNTCTYADPQRKAQLISLNAKQMETSPNKLETQGYALLSEIGVEFIPQYVVNGKFSVDAFLPIQNAVIQFDGDYWHGKADKFPKLDHRQKKRKALDVSQDAYMKKLGIKVVRFWESDFNNIQSVREKLLQLI